MRLLPASIMLAAAVFMAACGRKPATASPGPAPFPGAAPPVPAQPSTPVVAEPPPPPIVPIDPPVTTRDPLMTAAIDAINRESPFVPVFFAYDSDALDEAARRAIATNAEILKKYPTWIVTIEGHCDERGTAEYNLALGDRRALAAKNYLVTLGIAAERLRTVSYGSEFPFDPGHTEEAWAKNRRAHFMLTAR